MLQDSEIFLGPTHSCPPLAATTLTLRILLLVPSPQLFEHSLNFQSFHSQSTTVCSKWTIYTIFYSKIYLTWNNIIFESISKIRNIKQITLFTIPWQESWIPLRVFVSDGRGNGVPLSFHKALFVDFVVSKWITFYIF